MPAQPEYLQLDDDLVFMWDKGFIEREDIEEVVEELHRLHAELDDYKKTCDELIRSSCNDQAEIVKLEDQRDELLEALGLITEVGDRAATEIARAAIAKVGEQK